MIEYIDADAVNNALNLFLTSKKGDFLYNPGAGGILDTPLFKSMTPQMFEMLRFNLRNAITNYFTPFVTINSIDIIPDYNNHILEIKVTYKTDTGSTQQTTVFVNADFHTKHYEYTNVEYVGENLLNFCQIKKSDMTSEILTFDDTDNLWKYGSYIFTAFNFQTDPYAEAILLVCNG